MKSLLIKEQSGSISAAPKQNSKGIPKEMKQPAEATDSAGFWNVSFGENPAGQTPACALGWPLYKSNQQSTFAAKFVYKGLLSPSPDHYKLWKV